MIYTTIINELHIFCCLRSLFKYYLDCSFRSFFIVLLYWSYKTIISQSQFNIRWESIALQCKEIYKANSFQAKTKQISYKYNELAFYLIKEERVSEILHVIGDGQLALQSKIQFLQRPSHLFRQNVHSFTFLVKQC